MSHSYEVKLKESIREVVKVNEEWKSIIETLPILSQLEMGKILGEELEKENDWSSDKGIHTKKEKNWTIIFDEEAMMLSISYDDEKVFENEGEEIASGYNPGFSDGPLIRKAKNELRQKLKNEIQDDIDSARQRMNSEVENEEQAIFDEVEGLFKSLVEKTQIKALKRKAKSIGEIESIQENQESGEIKITINI